MLRRDLSGYLGDERTATVQVVQIVQRSIAMHVFAIDGDIVLHRPQLVHQTGRLCHSVPYGCVPRTYVGAYG
jgi:hypothetical protein